MPWRLQQGSVMLLASHEEADRQLNEKMFSSCLPLRRTNDGIDQDDFGR